MLVFFGRQENIPPEMVGRRLSAGLGSVAIVDIAGTRSRDRRLALTSSDSVPAAWLERARVFPGRKPIWPGLVPAHWSGLPP
jgi:hypothetical protein